MANDVDPRFARWFGRQVVLYARGEEELFIQKVRRVTLEQWTKAKTNLYQVAFVLFPLTVNRIMYLMAKTYFALSAAFCLIVFFCFQLFLAIAFSFLPVVVWIPVFTFACHYRNAVDVCGVSDYNLTVIISNTTFAVPITAENMYRWRQFALMSADFVEWYLGVLRLAPVFQLTFPDMNTLCAKLNEYQVF